MFSVRSETKTYIYTHVFVFRTIHFQNNISVRTYISDKGKSMYSIFVLSEARALSWLKNCRGTEVSRLNIYLHPIQQKSILFLSLSFNLQTEDIIQQRAEFMFPTYIASCPGPETAKHPHTSTLQQLYLTARIMLFFVELAPDVAGTVSSKLFHFRFSQQNNLPKCLRVVSVCFGIINLSLLGFPWLPFLPSIFLIVES